MDIRLAGPGDVPAIMELEARHYIGNLGESDRAEGFISILHPADWFHATVAGGGVHVGVTDAGVVAGFIAVTPAPPPSGASVSPIIRAVLDLADTVEFNGRLVAQQRFAFRGPVLVDRSARGKGLYSGFNHVTRQAYAGRFDIGVLFVSADNPRSLHTATTKLGAQPLAVFDVDGSQYHCLAFTF